MPASSYCLCSAIQSLHYGGEHLCQDYKKVILFKKKTINNNNNISKNNRRVRGELVDNRFSIGFFEDR